MGHSSARTGWAAVVCLAALMGCRGDGGSSPAPVAPNPPPTVPPPGPPTPPPPANTTPPGITSQPSTVTVPAGGSATLTVVATGSGVLSYQWSFNGMPIPGATQAALSLASVGTAQAGDYTVTVTNDTGTITSQAAQVILLAPPAISQDPVSVTATEGTTATFSVSANGSGLQYQWLRDGAQIAGANDASYTTPPLTGADTGAVYAVRVSNDAGQVTSPGAVLTVEAVVAPPAAAVVSASHAGGPSNHHAATPSISADGRYVAFNSFATDLIAAFPQGAVGSERNHAFRRDLLAGTTLLINQTTTGGVSTHDAYQLRLSANGRFALFSSLAGDLVTGDTNGSFDVFLRDIDAGTTIRVNLLPNGNQIEGVGGANFDMRLSISGDGRFVSFASTHDVATGGTGVPNDGFPLYVRDMQTGITRLVEGTQAPNQVNHVAMSDDGWLAYQLYTSQTDTITIALHDVAANAYAQPFSYVQGAFPAGARPGLSVSDHGRYVAFALNVPTLTGSNSDQVMVVDRDVPGIATVVSTGASGMGDGASTHPRISGDGRYVLFETIAPNLTGGLALPWRRFPVIRDRVAEITFHATHRTNGEPVWTADFGASTLSSDGSTVAFTADYSEVVGGSVVTQVFAEPRQ